MLELVRAIARQVCAEDLPETPFLFGGSVGPANAEEYLQRTASTVPWSAAPV
jgi:hypothetical protein